MRCSVALLGADTSLLAVGFAFARGCAYAPLHSNKAATAAAKNLFPFFESSNLKFEIAFRSEVLS